MQLTRNNKQSWPLSVYHHFLFFSTLKKKESRFKIRRKLFYLVSVILFFNDPYLNKR